MRPLEQWRVCVITRGRDAPATHSQGPKSGVVTTGCVITGGVIFRVRDTTDAGCVNPLSTRLVTGEGPEKWLPLVGRGCTVPKA